MNKHYLRRLLAVAALAVFSATFTATVGCEGDVGSDGADLEIGDTDDM